MQNSRMIAVLTDEYIDYRKVIVDHIAAIMKKAGYGTLCVAGHELEPVNQHHLSSEVCNRIYPLIKQTGVQGIISLSGTIGQNVSADKLSRFTASYQVPTVSLGLELDNIPSIIVDDSQGMTQLMEHLICDTNRKRFVFIRGKITDSYSISRENIFRAMIAKSGRKPDDCIFVTGNYDTFDTYKRMSELLSREKNIDAIVAANDTMALSAARAVNVAGLKIPQDIRVSGFDDTHYATKNSPAITTVRQPLFKMAELSADLLLKRMCNPNADLNNSAVEKVYSELVVRGSTVRMAPVSGIQDSHSDKYLASQLVSLMSGLSKPAGFVLPKLSQALWDTLTNGSPELEKFLTQWLERGLLAADLHWWSNLCHQIEVQATQFSRINQRMERLPLITSTLALVREKIWSVSMDQEFEVQRIQSTQSGMQSQMSSCTELRDILATMGRWLESLQIRRCFLIRYKEPCVKVGETAELIYVYRDGQAESRETESFATKMILPASLASELNSGLLVLNPVYAGSQQFGYLLLDPVGLDRLQLDSAAHSIGNAMRNQYLINKLESQTANLREVNADLVQLANHDALTGLPNRLHFQKHLLECCRKSRRSTDKVALLFIDLDGFKLINDSLGHSAGDQLLQKVSQRLIGEIQLSVGDDGFLARLGGDEFTAIVNMAVEQDELEILTRSLLHTITLSYELENSVVNVSASIGCAIFPEHGVTAPALLKSADTAMYRAKELGKNCVVFYTPELAKTDQSELQLDQAMRADLQAGLLRMHFQPRIDVSTGKICAVEGLMRWFDSTTTGELVRASPEVFIPIAERTGFISELDLFALETCCRQASLWRQAGTPICVSVNLSVVKLQQDDFVEQVKEILGKHQVDPSLIELEITESTAMTNVEDNVVKLNQLRALGLQLSIDDFGTGYSSLNYLKRLPVNNLKIDRSFLRGITCEDGGNSADSAIVRAVVALGKSLEFGLVAEGVETLEQYQFVKSVGCDQVQGYFFAKPQPAEIISAMLVEQQNQPRAA